MNKLKEGLLYETQKQVKITDTAIRVGSGDTEVLATPILIALMEKAAMQAVIDHLEEGQSTVGIHVDINHLAPTPIDMNVRALAKLVSIDGRKLCFELTAFDEKEKIGEGTHERFIIEKEKFMKKVNEKKL